MNSKIRFDFAPADGKSPFAVEKDEGGKRRRYLYGVSSGTQVDGHGERMTEECVKSFHKQAQSGNVKLYAGKHDVNFVDDIGILVDSQVTPEGDWVTGYRLYDEDDGFGSNTMEAVDKVWRQVNGIAPYGTPEKYGFSIEGEIPEGKVVSMDASGRRQMADVELSGTVLVKKPAYRTSVAHAVMKALGIPTPQEVRRTLLGEKDLEGDFYDAYCQVQDAVDREISAVMVSGEPDKRDRLRGIFDEYADVMIELISKHPDAFASEAVPADGGPSQIYESSRPDRRQDLLVRLATEQNKLAELVQMLRAGGTDHAAAQEG